MVKYVYDAWGNHAVEVLDSACAELSQLNPYRYRGYYYDTETGLYFLKTRYYDPEVGRFITIDDLSYIDPETINGLNLYAYCTNNPVMNIDPNGTWSWKKFWKGVGNFVAAVVVVAAVTALVVATAGGAAIALGASAAIVNAVVVGAAVGGMVAGAVEIGSQIHNNGFGNINVGSVALESFAGSAYGAIAGVMGATTSGGLRLAMRGAIIGLNTAMAGMRTAMNGGSVADAFKSMGKSLAIGIAVQSIFAGIDFWHGAFNSHGREFVALNKILFGNKNLLMIAGIQLGKGIWKNLSPMFAEIWRNIIG